MKTEKYKVAILGTGNIGTDLLIKVMRSEVMECVAFVGRNYSSAGMIKAQLLNVNCSDKSIEYFQSIDEQIDLVFDATTAQDHLVHAPILRQKKIRVIDMTPAKLGPMCVPAVNIDDCLNEWNVNMVTCGGQASVPIAWVIGNTQNDIEYLEVVSSIASKSAGPGTRANLDEYIATTEKALSLFSGAKNTKAILNLNPAIPSIDMQTTVFAKVKNPNLDQLKENLERCLSKIKLYVPGYNLIYGPVIDAGRITIMVKVTGLGDYLPAYAGNLDIINCAAIEMAEAFAKVQYGK